MANKPWHRGDYVPRSKAIRALANADPSTRCWRCGRTLAEHPRHRNGRKPFWTSGHVRDADPSAPLLPEASVCNFAAGATAGNLARAPRTASKMWK